MRIQRDEILKRLHKNIEEHIPIIGTGAGTGISAKSEEAGGSDLIIVYDSGKYRMAGHPSLCGLLAYGSANEIVRNMGREVLPVVKHTPVIAGVMGTDPFVNIPAFLKELAEMGYSGVQNFPSVASLAGRYREELEQTGLGHDREVEMIKIAHDMDLLTTPYAWFPEEAEKMAAAGADVIVAHCRCTIGGAVGVKDCLAMEQAIERIQQIRDAAVAVNPDVIVLCHGGPIVTSEDFAYVLERTTGISGFYGASSIERLPVERAISETVRSFKRVTM